MKEMPSPRRKITGPTPHLDIELTLDRKQCPPVVWHILEVIVNAMMVIEVTTRWIAYGKVSWVSSRILRWL